MSIAFRMLGAAGRDNAELGFQPEARCLREKTV
jgi:hypothetical protein